MNELQTIYNFNTTLIEKEQLFLHADKLLFQNTLFW